MPSVLVVDDSAVVRLVLWRRLSAAGIAVREETTSAGARAVDTADLACAIIDIELPDGSGVDLAAAMLARNPSLRVAFFTSSTATPVVERARSLGRVFSKPEVDRLLEWVGGPGPQPPPTK